MIQRKIDRPVPTQSVLLVDADSRKDIHNNVIGKYITHYEGKNWLVDVKKLLLPGYPHKRKVVEIDASKYDAVRVSIIFKRNKDMVKITGCDDVIFGGTGYDVKLKLPLEIDDLEATMYGDSKERIEFLTRGCIRKCYFCLVPEKEGELHEYRSLERILSNYHGERIRFFDNNFLAWDKSKEVLQLLIDKKIPVSFNEGLDIRMIDEENALLLSKLNNYRPDYTFAFDDWKLLPIIIEKTRILKQYFGDWKLKYYIFTDADKPPIELKLRIEWCRENKILPYTMRYENCYESPLKNFYTDISAWTNQAGHFKKTQFHEFLGVRHKNTKGIINTARVKESLRIFESETPPASVVHAE